MHLVDKHEVEDGKFVDGFVEAIGEADVYKRRRQFESCTMKGSIIDGGIPQVDSNQGEVNFQQLLKKDKAAKKKTLSSSELQAILAAAKAKAADRQAASSSKPDPSPAPASGDNGEIDVEKEEEDDESRWEDSADAALQQIISKKGTPKKAVAGEGGKTKLRRASRCPEPESPQELLGLGSFDREGEQRAGRDSSEVLQERTQQWALCE